MTTIAQGVGAAPAAAPPPTDPAVDAARTLTADHTRFGAVDAPGLAQAVADAPGDRTALAAAVTRGLDARDQTTFVSELTVIAHRPAAPAAADDRPHGLFDHMKDAGGVVWGAAKDLGHLAVGVGRTASDLTLGPAVDAAREAAGLMTGHTPQAPGWAPSAARGVQSVETAGRTAWTAATHPGAVLDALKAPYQKDVAEGRWGALAAQAVLDFGGLLDGESEALGAARVASAAERTSEAAQALSRGARATERLDGVLPGAARAEGEASTAVKASEGAQALTRVSAATGRNAVTWTVNAQGRGVEARAVLRESFEGAERSGAETKLTQDVGASGGRTTDDGGHMIAHRFMKDQGERNMFPQNANFNRGAYKTMENEWAAWTQAGGEVRVDVKLEEFAGKRPAEVRVSYEVVNPQTGKVVYDNIQKFSNEAGQTFARQSGSQIAKLLHG